MAGVIEVHRWTSPAGELILGSIGESLCMCDWASRPGRASFDSRICRYFRAEFRPGISSAIGNALDSLKRYFAGELTAFNLPISLAGTDFQRRVWEQLIQIPYGETISYSQLACRLSRPTAVRAVANAVGANPISIIVPCHRIIGASGALTGYAGGLPAKTLLLSIELRTKNILKEQRTKNKEQTNWEAERRTKNKEQTGRQNEERRTNWEAVCPKQNKERRTRTAAAQI